MRIQVKYPALLAKRVPPKFVAPPLEHFYPPSTLAHLPVSPYPGPLALAKHLLSREPRGISLQRFVDKYRDEYPRQLFTPALVERAVFNPLREQGYITVAESRDLSHPDVQATADHPTAPKRGVALLYSLHENSRPFTLDADQLNELRIQKENCSRLKRLRDENESVAKSLEDVVPSDAPVDLKVDAFFKRVGSTATPAQRRRERTALFVKMMQGKVDVNEKSTAYHVPLQGGPRGRPLERRPKGL